MSYSATYNNISLLLSRASIEERKTCYVFTGKERDEETGYGYFGARYMDHELMTMWLSVDPMSDKYPNMSPYNYCAWNPVRLIDPDGRDWVVIFDHEKKTVTIEAKYATNSDDAKVSAEKAVKTWNDLSGEYSLMVGKEKYAVNFNLSVISEDEYDFKDKSHNQYSLVPFCVNDKKERDDNVMGTTYKRIVNVRESEKDNYVTSSHEIGHTLGLLHNLGSKGLMEEDGGRKSRNHEITKANVETILKFALHPEMRDPRYASGRGSYQEIGCSNVDVTNCLNLRLIKTKK